MCYSEVDYLVNKPKKITTLGSIIMSTTNGRALLRQRRIMGYFIEAADEIIKQEGIDAVTIRRVSDKAGYTSATLYNYFDNLNHLVFLASMSHILEYNNEIERRVANCENSVEIYLTISECFCEYSFNEPEIYNLLFYGNLDDKREDYTRQFYELFEDKNKNWPPTLSKIININNLFRRSHIMVTDCVDDGYFSPENGEDFNEVAMMVYRSILKDVREGKLNAKEAAAKNMKYYRQLMGFYIKPEYRGLLEK